MPNISTDQQRDPSKMDNVDILRIYDFDFFKKALEAFVWQLTIRFRKYRQDFPVYLFNSGDEAFLLNEQRTLGAGTLFKTSDIYQKKPRVEISIGDLQISSDQFTSPFREGLFTLNIDKRDVTFHGPVERIPVVFSISAKLVCDSLLHSLTYMELLLTMLNEFTNFEFWHAKRRHQGIFQIEMNLQSEKNLELNFGADTRDYTINFPISLQLQFPAFDFFNPLKNSIKPTTSGIITDIDHNIYPDGGAGDQDDDQIDDGPISSIIGGDEDDGSSDAHVGNVHQPVIMPGINPDGSIINPNKPSTGATDSNTSWKDTASTPELSSDVLDIKDKNRVGPTHHYPM